MAPTIMTNRNYVMVVRTSVDHLNSTYVVLSTLRIEKAGEGTPGTP